MYSFIEKILIYIIGSISGFLVGHGIVTILNIQIPSIYILSINQTVIIFCTIIGILISIIIVGYKDRKKIIKNSDLRNETVALLTHEMRTGLTSTSWAIQTMLNDYDQFISKEDKTMLSNIIKSIHTTVMHTMNLLDVSLLDIGKLSIALERVKLDKIERMFQETLEKFQMGTLQKGITLKSNIKLDHSKSIEVDLIRLRIIVENMIENAMQYTTNKIKEIDINITNDKKNLLIKIHDTGIGIPNSEKENIFKEFYRAKNAKLVLSSGSGIGLYTCAQYIKAHNGKINFESEEGIGTTFFISIPLQTSVDVDDFLNKI